MQSAGTYIYRCTIHSLARHRSDARASSVYRSYARLTIVSANMHFIVSEYVYFVHVFYDNSVHVTCIDLRSNRSLAYSQSRGCAHNRYTPPYLVRDTSTFLDSVPRARGTCAHSSPLHAPYPRAEPSDSDSYPSHRRGHSHDSTPSSRENSRGHPLAINLQNPSFSTFAHVVHTMIFGRVRRHPLVQCFCVDDGANDTRDNTPATLIRACIAKLLRCLVKTSLYYRTRARNS